MFDEAPKFVATLSDGSTVVQDEGHWTEVPGERKPWIRLCEFTAKEGLTVTSLRLNFNGKTIHLPKERMDRFKFNDTNMKPLKYSLCYHVEVDDVFTGGGTEEKFIDLAAHYDTFTLHYINNITNDDEAYIVVSSNTEPLVPESDTPLS